jgi:twinkle protein
VCSKTTQNIPSEEKKTIQAPPPNTEKRGVRPVPDTFRALEDRQISQDTAKVYKFGYYEDGPFIHTYPRFRGDKHVANQFRLRGKKDFRWEGIQEKMELIGQHAFPAGSAKAITIVEGACDVGAAYELQGSQWPVVGVTAASTAVRECIDNYEYLNSFEKIVICMDSDEPGQEAARKLAERLPLGKTHIMTMRRHKDPNDYLRAGMAKEFKNEFWAAPVYMPAALKTGKELWNEIENPPDLSFVEYPWPSLTAKTYGLKLSEFTVINAETGVGKTTFTNEIAYKLLQTIPEDVKVGFMKLEETNRDSGLGLISIHANKRLHLPDVWSTLKEGELRGLYEEVLNNDRAIFWDHFGSNSIDAVLSKIQHMAALGCKYIILDHLSIIVADQSGDERKQLDEIVNKLKKECMSLRICVIAVIHQNRQGQIRGTAGVEQVSNDIFKLERERESPDDWRRNVVKLTIQKNRFAGMGGCVYLFFDQSTGRLVELSDDEASTYERGATISTAAAVPQEDWNFDPPPA